ncbi:MAG: tRNA lysidine(34) synthetase TilS [Nitrosomonas sp.]|nr:tRNA lysidine(34) synthetase TilS [Nitrosomonas sp.]MCW5607450.1 tRNA lysidine(34) synthetase TilS [Nitrosomonas sp.]
MVPTKRQKSNKATDPDALIRDTQNILLHYVTSGTHLVVGLSGGVDSVVLLDILTALSKQMRFKLSAVHVNHGISKNADAWSHFCCRLCYDYGIPIVASYVKVAKETGMSLEAIAREKRYQVFNRLHVGGMDTVDYLVLAQHRDDQAETLLLQLFRGAGVRGLSAMPLCRKQPSETAPQILRPLLDVSRDSIEIYAEQRQLQWIHDESNDSTLFSRNFLRHKVFPVLREKYPNYAQALQRTSRHMAEASQLLDELAGLDAQRCLASGQLDIIRLRELSLSRARNLLRYVLWQQGIQLPSTIRLEEILRQLRSVESDTQLHITFGNAEIRVYQGRVYIQELCKKWRAAMQQEMLHWEWQNESTVTLDAWGGSIHFRRIAGQGISQRKLLRAPVIIRSRQGGEHYRPGCNRPRRSLKNLLQEASIPPWSRYTLPLLYCGEQLVWVPGIGIDCDFQAMPEEIGIVPEWRAE